MGARHMTTMELQYQAQGGRCFWCAAFTLPCNLTWDHVIPRHITGLRRRQGRAGCVLAHERCNKSRGGKVIGTRTWGGVVGIRGSLKFIDGGFLNKPEFAHYAADSSAWIVEGHGVDPDIVVDNDPAKEYAGEDQQLNRAIDQMKEELKSLPKELPGIPPFPDKTK